MSNLVFFALPSSASVAVSGDRPRTGRPRSDRPRGHLQPVAVRGPEPPPGAPDPSLDPGHQAKAPRRLERALDRPRAAPGALGQGGVARVDLAAVAAEGAQGQQHVATGSGQVAGAKFRPHTGGPGIRWLGQRSGFLRLTPKAADHGGRHAFAHSQKQACETARTWGRVTCLLHPRRTPIRRPIQDRLRLMACPCGGPSTFGVLGSASSSRTPRIARGGRAACTTESSRRKPCFRAGQPWPGAAHPSGDRDSSTAAHRPHSVAAIDSARSP